MIPMECKQIKLMITNYMINTVIMTTRIINGNIRKIEELTFCIL